jgi:hypothetical protein
MEMKWLAAAGSFKAFLVLHGAVLKGHGFSRAKKSNRMNWASAPAPAHLATFWLHLYYFRSLMA